MNVKTDVVTAHDFRYPITKEQYESAEASHEVAVFLVRSANVLDLESVARRLRGAA